MLRLAQQHAAADGNFEPRLEAAMAVQQHHRSAMLGEPMHQRRADVNVKSILLEQVSGRRLDFRPGPAGGLRMPTLIEQIKVDAMKLSSGERDDLGERPWHSVHTAEEVEAAWDAEIARRIRQINSGEVECVPLETVMAELRAKFG